MDGITILELNQRLSAVISSAPNLRNIWVVGETSDLRVAAGGHCYLELVQKDDKGNNVSRIRANIWAGIYSRLRVKFFQGTGAELASGMKIMVCVSASYHPSYGMSVTVSDIDPGFTVGDALRRRKEIVERLTREGLINRNRELSLPWVPNRIAVVSAKGAAGYGDFVNQLFTNPRCFRFEVELFEAVMQGERTVPTVMQALNLIASAKDRFDAVVIIRGGGATTDLAAFDNYDLAAAVAGFPLPVIVGIGHERDTTVLDYVAHQRVKTPTAAAEMLVERVGRLYDSLSRAAERIYQSASERIAAHRELLAHAAASLPGMATAAVMNRRAVLERNAYEMTRTVAAAVNMRRDRLNIAAANISAAATRAVERGKDRLTNIDRLLAVLSPDSVLARGYSLTMLADGRILTRVADATPGSVLVTRLADGEVTSTVKSRL